MGLAVPLRSALRAGWLCGALVVLLLFAQHGALTHALVHAGWQAHAETGQLHQPARHPAADHDGHGDGVPADAAADSCTFDLVYSQVLGGVHAGTVALSGGADPRLCFAAEFSARDGTTVVPYDTRGPPALS